MLRTWAISSLLFAGAVSVANADVFRWVDDHGGVHYSDQWVPGSEVIKSSKPHPTSSSVTADTSHRTVATPSSSSSSSISNDQNTKAVKQDVAKAREQQCKDAKDRYGKAIQARRIYKAKQGDTPKDDDRPADREYMSDQEADAYRAQVRQEVQDYCGSVPKESAE
ncbi:MAG: DUF4124 domain-containing protein [Sinobacteraceae bacterium]|nr:DUF4124 domain-containing protein [Nevskiaceae bacterium]